MDDTIFVWETKEANVAIVRVVVVGNCSAHAPAATPWTKPVIIWGGFGMPEENIVGIVCGTSEVWGGST